MPFIDDPKPFYGPIAIPDGLDVTPDPETYNASVLGAAFRRENEIVSYASSYHYDPDKPFDPEYRPWDDIEGTPYERYASRFYGARDREDVAGMKAQIDRESEDAAVLDSSGWLGTGAQMFASLLSPTSLLPGGAIVKGAKGIKIAETALSVGVSATTATAIQEAMLHGSQATRTGEESAFAIGGSLILGGALGGLVGKLSAKEMAAAGRDVQTALDTIQAHDEVLRGGDLSAASTQRDLEVYREKIFSTVDKIPGLRAIVRSDPVLRAMLSPNQAAREALADLVDTPLSYKANAEGISVRPEDGPVEARIKARERTELAGTISSLQKHYGEYWKDGPVGTIGTLTAPIQSWSAGLVNRSGGKMTAGEFMEEVGKALRRGDKHPIPQVQSAADELRRTVFDKVKQELIDLGRWNADVEVKNADSYLSRIYLTEKITRNLGEKNGDDILPVLEREFTRRRDQIRADLQGKPVSDQIAAGSDEAIAAMDDAEIKTAVRETVQAIIGLKPGENAFHAVMSKPMRARVLDVRDEVLEPWLESDAEAIVGHYFRSMVPEIELIRTFGDVEMTGAITKIKDEGMRRVEAAKTPKAKQEALAETQARVAEISAMRDRMRGIYGVPENPRSIWVQGGRAARGLSYMGYLGGMTLAAIPDVAGVIGRGGIEQTFGAAATLLMDPKRLFKSIVDMKDFGAHGEWFLNSRAMSLAEVTDPYSRGTMMERALGQGGRYFSILTGMIPWNVGWKSIGASMLATRFSKAAVADAAGKATKAQAQFLAANGISTGMARRIAKQIEMHGDTQGLVWLPQGRLWTDREAFNAMNRAMNREIDLMVVTPGQDKPLIMSNEAGKFFTQFKSFAFSAHHRVLLAGIQKADADVLAQFTMALLLGGLVSNIKADLGGYERKQGAAFWEDALDRSGLAGWLMEPYNALGGLTSGMTSISGEPVSRFEARSRSQGVLGPSVDMWMGVSEGITGITSGKPTYRDIRKLMRPIPGNNLTYLSGLFQQIEDAGVAATGAKPRQ